VKEHVLWRGAEPDKEGVTWLIEHGVRTIVNLELFHDDLARIEQVDLGSPKIFKVGYFRVKDWEPLPALAPSVEEKQVVHFLTIASQQAYQPVYVHCRSGQNRTGVMVAAYQIIIEAHPDVDAVIEEMMNYQGFWSDLDAAYLRNLALRRSEVLRKIGEKISRLEDPAQIICQDRKCTFAHPGNSGTSF
jgi:protein tyrosine phosphatase